MERPDAMPFAAFEALRSDLVRGELGRLDVHLANLAALGDDLLSGAHRPGEPEAVRAEAERTGAVLAAAACGLRAALRRLGEAGAPATVYAADGRRVSLAGQQPSHGSHA
jgi:hypothetical protein